MYVAQRFQPRVPDGFDITRPNEARVHDYLLLGKDNFAADRVVAEQLEAAGMQPRRHAMANRDFLVRAVRAVAARGVAQFLDLGAGLPASPSVDAVARQALPDARVAYIDHDPVVVAHNAAILGTTDGVASIRGDLRDPRAVLDQVCLRGCVDFGRPVAVVLVGVLHFITDDENPAGIIAAIRDRLAPGSVLVLATATADGADPGLICAAKCAYRPALMPFTFRARDQIEAFFDGFELLEPGVVSPPDWRPEESTDRTALKTPALCGVGQLRK